MWLARLSSQENAGRKFQKKVTKTKMIIFIVITAIIILGWNLDDYIWRD